jgi:hypothetical protein
MRQYEPIWQKLKSMPLEEAAKKGVSITANRAVHKRIIKAVVKEKWLDFGYKISIEPRRAILLHSRSNSILTFRLTLSVKTIDASCV